MLRNKAAAPDFSLTDIDGNVVSLKDLHQGRPLVLLFFRGEFCPTARRDLQAYSDIYNRAQALGAELVGISADTPSNHAVLRNDLWIPFPLLSDPTFAGPASSPTPTSPRLSPPTSARRCRRHRSVGP